MIQTASVIDEPERQIIRSKVNAGLDRVRAQGKKLGRRKVLAKVEATIREHLSAGHGTSRWRQWSALEVGPCSG
jgi:DNA invertase Pin-like site-specific DNA recombinase